MAHVTPVVIGGVIWPDAESQKSINEIRAKWDPHLTVIAPHITIIFPTESAIPPAEAAERLTEAVEGLGSFPVTLDRVSSLPQLAREWPHATAALLAYPNAVNAIFLLSGKGTAEMLDLKARIAVALGLSTPLVQYPPYLTLGQTLTDERYQAALRSLSGYAPDYSFEVESFDFLTQTESGGWETARTISLAP